MDNLDRGRVELNMISLSGPMYKDVDLRLLNLELVKKGLTNAVLFNEEGQVVLAADELYKKVIQVVRGSYRPPTLVNVDMINAGQQKFSSDLRKKLEEITQAANEIFYQPTPEVKKAMTDFAKIIEAHGPKVEGGYSDVLEALRQGSVSRELQQEAYKVVSQVAREVNLKGDNIRNFLKVNNYLSKGVIEQRYDNSTKTIS